MKTTTDITDLRNTTKRIGGAFKLTALRVRKDVKGKKYFVRAGRAYVVVEAEAANGWETLNLLSGESVPVSSVTFPKH